MPFKRPTIGSTRVIRRFALFPIKVDDEIYWLEMIKIHQTWNPVKEKWNNDYTVD